MSRKNWRSTGLRLAESRSVVKRDTVCLRSGGDGFIIEANG